MSKVRELIKEYYRKVAKSNLVIDDNQMQLLAKLQPILGHLSRPAWLNKLSQLRPWGRGEEGNTSYYGIYVYGEVGRGKTMLMDIFAKSLGQRHLKIHFHEFMLKVHSGIERLKHKEKPMEAFLQEFKGLTLLCLDEMEIIDIADAMILQRVFRGLKKMGVFVYTTSNAPPWDLYKGGLHRDRFMPTIDFIKNKFAIYNLNSPQDYRMCNSNNDQAKGAGTPGFLRYFSCKLAMDAYLAKTATCVGRDSTMLVPSEDNAARTIHSSVGVVGQRSFSDLFESNIGAQEYLNLAKQCAAIAIDKVPHFGQLTKDHMRRLVVFLDILYDYQVGIIFCGQSNSFDDLKALERLPERSYSRLVALLSLPF